MSESVQALNERLDLLVLQNTFWGKRIMLTLMANLVLKQLNCNHKDIKNDILYLNLSIVLLLKYFTF